MCGAHPGDFGGRRAVGVILASLALLLAACAADQPIGPTTGSAAAGAAPRPLLAPWLTLTGARVAPTLDPTGMPSLRSGAIAFTRFVHPSAVAAQGNDVYIVDQGAGAVFRFDIALNVMTPLRGVPAHGATRITVGGDYSLYALDAANRRVMQFARGGQLLATFSDLLNLARPIDIALDEARGLLLVADGAFNQIVAFHPLGRASFVIHLRGDARHRVTSIGALAVGPDALYLSDPGCRCIARVARDGTVLDTFGHDVLGQPAALAVDRNQRVFVADAFDRSVKIFHHGKIVHSFTAGELGALQVSGLALGDGTLALADGAGARVQLLRVGPPER